MQKVHRERETENKYNTFIDKLKNLFNVQLKSIQIEYKKAKQNWYKNLKKMCLPKLGGL